MGIKEDINKVEKKLKRVEEQSFAFELLSDFKKQNRRLFIIWIITFASFISLLGYTLWLLNDIGTYEDIITQENENGYNNYIGNDGVINNGKTNN